MGELRSVAQPIRGQLDLVTLANLSRSGQNVQPNFTLTRDSKYSKFHFPPFGFVSKRCKLQCFGNIISESLITIPHISESCDREGIVATMLLLHNKVTLVQRLSSPVQNIVQLWNFSNLMLQYSRLCPVTLNNCWM